MTQKEETSNFLGTGDAISCESNGYCAESFREACDDYDEPDQDCYECGGEGWITDDCFEDTCCCLDPDEEHGIIPCPRCNNPRGDQ